MTLLIQVLMKSKFIEILLVYVKISEFPENFKLISFVCGWISWSNQLHGSVFGDFERTILLRSATLLVLQRVLVLILLTTSRMVLKNAFFEPEGFTVFDRLHLQIVKKHIINLFYFKKKKEARYSCNVQ